MKANWFSLLTAGIVASIVTIVGLSYKQYLYTHKIQNATPAETLIYVCELLKGKATSNNNIVLCDLSSEETKL